MWHNYQEFVNKPICRAKLVICNHRFVNFSLRPLQINFMFSRPGNGFLIQAAVIVINLFKWQGSRLQETCNLTGTLVKIEFMERHPNPNPNPNWQEVWRPKSSLIPRPSLPPVLIAGSIRGRHVLGTKSIPNRKCVSETKYRVGQGFHFLFVSETLQVTVHLFLQLSWGYPKKNVSDLHCLHCILKAIKGVITAMKINTADCEQNDY